MQNQIQKNSKEYLTKFINNNEIKNLNSYFHDIVCFNADSFDLRGFEIHINKILDDFWRVSAKIVEQCSFRNTVFSKLIFYLDDSYFSAGIAVDVYDGSKIVSMFHIMESNLGNLHLNEIIKSFHTLFPLKKFKFNKTIHSPSRMKIIMLLLQWGQISFSELIKELEYTSGRAIIHCSKLEEGGIIERKLCLNQSNRFQTVYSMTDQGLIQYSQYVSSLSSLFQLVNLTNLYTQNNSTIL